MKNMKKSQYSLEIKSERTGEKLSFGSVDGIASKNSFSEPELLIADEASPRGKTLFWRSGYGFLPVLFTGVEDVNPKAAGRSARASELTERNLRKNGREAEVRKASTPSEISERFDSAVYAPRPYSPVGLVKEEISEILKSLEEGGNIFLSGRKKTGIKRYGRMLKEMEGETEKISRGKKVLYRYEKDGEIKESFGKTEKEFIISLEDFQAEMKASEGLFSSGKLDKGSKLLMKNIEVDEGEKALDLACGYGAVGLYLRKKFSTDLTLSDDDLLAVRYAERNFRENDAEGEFVHCDCLESFSEEGFDVIVSNPPTHQGRGITDEMFEESYTKLRPGGRLVIVYNMNMGFRDQLEEIFDSTEVLEDRDNFRVLKASKSF